MCHWSYGPIANLEGYGVQPETLADALMSEPLVNAYAIFIAEPEVAKVMQSRMPHGRAHVCMDNDRMPLLLKEIFTKALLVSRSSL